MTAQNSKPRLLVVDDSKVMRLSAIKILRSDFDVVVAQDGEDGWTKLESDQSIQAVFTDLSMPKLDGFELLTRIRNCDDNTIAELPVVIITGGEDEASREKALGNGATDFITKPFDSVDLKARAKAHTHASTQAQKLRATTNKLATESGRDPLTQLINKQFFLQRIKKDIALCHRHQKLWCLLSIELQGFKALFIQAGKEIADKLQVQAAEAINDLIRQEDSASRIGLGQFAISLPAASADGTHTLCQRLKEKLHTAVNPQDNKLQVTLRAFIPNLQPPKEPGYYLETCIKLQTNNPQIAIQIKDQMKTVASSTEAGEAQLKQQPPIASDAKVANKNSPPLAKEKNPKQPVASTTPIKQKPALSVDQALEKIQRGGSEEVQAQLPLLLKTVLPLLDALTKNQKLKLISYLHQSTKN